MLVLISRKPNRPGSESKSLLVQSLSFSEADSREKELFSSSNLPQDSFSSLVLTRSTECLSRE
jgi:hypothetical protein